jgi:hypothetical protein
MLKVRNCAHECLLILRCLNFCACGHVCMYVCLYKCFVMYLRVYACMFDMWEYHTLDICANHEHVFVGLALKRAHSLVKRTRIRWSNASAFNGQTVSAFNGQNVIVCAGFMLA